MNAASRDTVLQLLRELTIPPEEEDQTEFPPEDTDVDREPFMDADSKSHTPAPTR